jgi:hypothetical protein
MSELTTRRWYQQCLIAVIAFLAAGAGLAAELDADQTKVIRLSDPVEQTADSESFGAPVDDSVTVVALEEIATSGGDYVGQPVQVVARVAKVCQKKGCFFFAQEGSSVVRVSFKDYGFFVPTDISGKRVTLVGEVVAREVTAEEADHYADDIGADAPPVKQGEVYEIVASAVRVPRG